ncbi:hypothetical protein CDV55_106337 [Aspergillus turcosus]|uniref:Uncharacterized protein n=1 Tax=Aspergillus turcosus TaxID=1245748 RepID=A0A229YTS1_9EURO|nr:hypothetical protein CDV55_106337 [Aspergillus turcosus]RLM00100.1 hypothetical protein CFD26_107655 [Aspergillus turcosus]
MLLKNYTWEGLRSSRSATGMTWFPPAAVPVTYRTPDNPGYQVLDGQQLGRPAPVDRTPYALQCPRAISEVHNHPYRSSPVATEIPQSIQFSPPAESAVPATSTPGAAS